MSDGTLNLRYVCESCGEHGRLKLDDRAALITGLRLIAGSADVPVTDLMPTTTEGTPTS